MQKRTTRNFLLLALLCFLPVSFAKGIVFAKNEPTLAPMLQEAIPAVVHLENLQYNADPEKPGMPVGTTASGVIVNSKEGYVLTNWHVIKGADEINVTLHDQRRLSAKVLGGDPATDLAVLQIPAENLKAMPLGNSEELQVGDFVLTIGNPFGLQQTVTSGIVSALGRSELGIDGFEDFIQTDAPINPGNSGGALINLEGKLIGINTAIIGAYGNIGIGFAIPINMANAIMQQIITYGEVRRGILGIIAQPLTPDLAKAFNSNLKNGAVVSHVLPESPAEESGLQAGDIITNVNGQKITSASEMRNLLSVTTVGEKLKIELQRQGKKQTINLEVQDPMQLSTTLSRIHPSLGGIELRPVDTVLPRHGQVTGLEIITVAEGSPAWRLGLRPQDIITSVDQQPVGNVSEIEDIVGNNRDELLLRVVRGPAATFVVMQ
jgi:Do/DeqQ family serine protease